MIPLDCHKKCKLTNSLGRLICVLCLCQQVGRHDHGRFLKKSSEGFLKLGLNFVSWNTSLPGRFYQKVTLLHTCSQTFGYGHITTLEVIQQDYQQRLWSQTSALNSLFSLLTVWTQSVNLCCFRTFTGNLGRVRWHISW